MAMVSVRRWAGRRRRVRRPRPGGVAGGSRRRPGRRADRRASAGPRRPRRATSSGTARTMSASDCPLACARASASFRSWCATDRPRTGAASITTRSAKIAPRVASRLARMRAGSTARPAITSRIASSAAPVACSASAITGHSACQAPTARSCSWTRPASIVAARPGRRAAAASVRAHPDGFCLCGIADDPPPASRTSPTSNCIRRLTSRAILPSTPAYDRAGRDQRREPIARRCATAHRHPAPARARAPALSPTSGPRSPSAASVPEAPPSWTRTASRRACSTRDQLRRRLGEPARRP